jgi:hypothetical protein
MELHTPDIVLAATLLYYGAIYKDVELFEHKGTFVLLNVVEHDIEHFNRGRLLVDPYMFNLKMRYLSKMVKDKLKLLA